MRFSTTFTWRGEDKHHAWRALWVSAVKRIQIPTFLTPDSTFWQDDPIEQIRGHTMRVAFPRDLDVKRLIDKMADYVSREGPDFERMIIQRWFDLIWFIFGCWLILPALDRIPQT
jgi:hypothetical protein